MKFTHPSISVIVACYNGELFIKPCLDSLLASTYPNFSIVVVNDASIDGTKDILNLYEQNKQITIIHSKINRGLAVSNNTGAKNTNSPYLLFLNQDTEVDPECLANIVKTYEKKKDIGIIQIQLVNRNKTINTAGYYISITGFPYDPWAGETISRHQKEEYIFGAKNAGLAVQRKLFFSIGCFDTDYFIYCEDTDLCWRSWINGYKTLYVPSATAYHFEGSTITPETSYTIVYEGAKNNLNYILKNAPFPMNIWMSLIHTLVWLLISIKFLITGKPHLAVWIVKGLWWNVIHIRKTIRKRVKIQNTAYTPYSEYKHYMYGPLSFASLLKKGIGWIHSL